MNISKEGYWIGEDVIHFHYHDPLLLDNLISFCNKYKTASIIDLGCGKGDYVIGLSDDGFCVIGYDGNPNTYNITNGMCHTLELHKDIKSEFIEEDGILTQFDLVISLEVGEHIPKEYEDVFINNLTTLANRWLIISWATPNQPGHGHVNCQPNSYIIEKIQSKGFSFDSKITSELRVVSHLPWLSETLMVFKKL